MIVLLYGADQASVQRRLKELHEIADGGTGMLETNVTRIDGRSVRPEDIIAPAMASPFLTPYRLVIVDHIVDRYEPPENSRFPGNSAEPMAPLFAAIEAGLPPSTILVLAGGASERNLNDFVKRVSRLSSVTTEHFPQLKAADLNRFIHDEAASQGVRIEGPAQSALAELSNGDTLLLANEIKKLALYTMGKPITAEAVAVLCSGERTASMFGLIDGILDGDAPKALASLRPLYRNETPESILAMLLGEFRRLATVTDLLEAGLSEPDIVKQTKFHSFVVQKAVKRGRRLGFHGVRRGLELLIQADRDSKTGVMRNEVAVETLIGRLVTLVAAPAR